MNLTKLFEAQAVLDRDIELRHPVGDGEDRLSKKILALLVELGECANEFRGFKFWSNDQEPRTSKWTNEDCKSCKGSKIDVEGIDLGNPYPCIECQGRGVVAYETNPLLEEYVDCLHFILSIGNDLNYKLDDWFIEKPKYEEPIEFVFNEVFKYVSFMHWETTYDGKEDAFHNVLETFLTLGERLGFTWEQIEQAYYDKNKVNFERQKSGY